MLLELQTWSNVASFVTLTYSPEYLPDTHAFPAGNLYKKHVQDYLKRLRFELAKKGRTCRYFAVGEYGDKSSRAHYHLILYGLDPLTDDVLIRSCWPFGFVAIGDVKSASIGYTVGYTLKKMTAEKDFLDGRTPEFSLMSRKPALGHFAIPEIGARLKKYNLIPRGFCNSFTDWLQKNPYGLYKYHTDFKDWEGNFKIGRHYARLDSVYMKKLAAWMYPDYADYLRSLDASFELFPQGFKDFRPFKAQLSIFRYRINVAKGVLDEAKAKAEARQRRSKATRTL